jgi:hypothetical protein
VDNCRRGQSQDAAAAGVLDDEELDELDVELSFEPLLDEPESDLAESLVAASLLAATPPPPERLSVR